MSCCGVFKLQFSLRRSEDDGPVFKKQDGDRFESAITVKLNANTKYTVFLTSRPARSIKKVFLKAEKLEINQQRPERADDNCNVYHADWSTIGFDVNKSNVRTYLPIVIEMDSGLRVETKLQVKVYPETETTHCKWGDELHMLDLECAVKADKTAVEIRKVQYI
ncbi:CB1 cannabinoid receptor-interacting protein 1-like [Physella acuta]|uniref:CB1 cannabinoid receptor-interacting protein 1-like n=1 Tax=Physella acuta TaxID=109671 RepID=UPI0027DBFB96|nr:CB1 cannabinoid receptor-interacting protein 1-like [Physella acuta]XP_059156302.1 CB1 cannabinoid receptor-interacting protein 1-like [Physella acuta]XP_059156303.1 CB1 cannabinoid receptor-interacting protein 1-like [Physella acuta]XP_059156305.1 CB1 cannabinoid receptor-interacting protein 1-like [Physella acuta]